MGGDGSDAALAKPRAARRSPRATPAIGNEPAFRLCSQSQRHYSRSNRNARRVILSTTSNLRNVRCNYRLCSVTAMGVPANGRLIHPTESREALYVSRGASGLALTFLYSSSSLYRLPEFAVRMRDCVLHMTVG